VPTGQLICRAPPPCPRVVVSPRTSSAPVAARACLPLPCTAPAAHGVLSCGRKPPRASYQELDMIRLLARMHAPADLDAAAHEAERVGTAHRVHALPCNMAVQLLSDREYIRDRYQGRSSLLACEFARRDACTRVVRSMGTAASVVGACSGGCVAAGRRSASAGWPGAGRASATFLIA